MRHPLSTSLAAALAGLFLQAGAWGAVIGSTNPAVILTGDPGSNFGNPWAVSLGTGSGQDVAVSANGQTVYTVGQANGNFLVTSLVTGDGANGSSGGNTRATANLGPGYGLGLGLGPAGQVGVIGGLLQAPNNPYVIDVLDPVYLLPLSGFPIYTSGYYDLGPSGADLGAASSTTYRASVVFDDVGNVYAGFNASSTTAAIQEYSNTGVLITSVTFSSSPYIYFEQIAIDTTTNILYSILEEPGATQINSFQIAANSLNALATQYELFIGTGGFRHQSITVGPNQVIAGGQDFVAGSTNVWSAQFARSAQQNLAYILGPVVTQNNPSYVPYFDIAQVPPFCGFFDAVGGAGNGLYFETFGNTLQRNRGYFAPNPPQPDQAAQGNAISIYLPDVDNYVVGTTTAGLFYAARFYDNSCNLYPPPVLPCIATPSAFPNPFRSGTDKVEIAFDLPSSIINTPTPPAVTLQIYGPTGALVTSFYPQAAVLTTIIWTGRDGEGNDLPPGNYDGDLQIAMKDGSGLTCHSLIRMGAR